MMMNSKKKDLWFKILIIISIVIIAFVPIFFTMQIKDMLEDHKCYIMISDGKPFLR